MVRVRRLSTVGTLIIVGVVLGQAAASAQTADAGSRPPLPINAPAQTSAGGSPALAGSIQRGAGGSPAQTQDAATDTKPIRKSKRKRFSAWLRGSDETTHTPASQEELVKAANDYNHHRTWIDDYPTDEFIPTGAGR